MSKLAFKAGNETLELWRYAPGFDSEIARRWGKHVIPGQRGQLMPPWHSADPHMAQRGTGERWPRRQATTPSTAATVAMRAAARWFTRRPLSSRCSGA